MQDRNQDSQEANRCKTLNLLNHRYTRDAQPDP